MNAAQYKLHVRREQGCLTDCVAFLFNVHPDRVPLFTYPVRGWARRMKAFFRRRGFRAQWQKCARAPRRGLWLVVGRHRRRPRLAHAVIYKDGQVIYDPNYRPGKWKTTYDVSHRLLVTR